MDSGRDTELPTYVQFCFVWSEKRRRHGASHFHPGQECWGEGTESSERGERVGLAFGSMALMGPQLSRAQCSTVQSHEPPPACYIRACSCDITPTSAWQDTLLSSMVGPHLRASPSRTQVPQDSISFLRFFVTHTREDERKQIFHVQVHFVICIISSISQNTPTTYITVIPFVWRD